MGNTNKVCFLPTASRSECLPVSIAQGHVEGEEGSEAEDCSGAENDPGIRLVKDEQKKGRGTGSGNEHANGGQAGVSPDWKAVVVD
jgi:hypothetical protein